MTPTAARRARLEKLLPKVIAALNVAQMAIEQCPAHFLGYENATFNERAELVADEVKPRILKELSDLAEQLKELK